MFKFILYLSITTCCSLPGLTFAQQLTDSIKSELTLGIQGFKDRYHTPSMVVAVVHRNKIVFSQSLGYTNLEDSTRATIDSKYPILSVTKLFTATMLMQLVQQEKIGLNDDIKKFLPEFVDLKSQSAKSDITFLQLATHTSGLPRNTAADLPFAKQVDEWMLNRKKMLSLEPSTKRDLLKSLKYTSKEYPEYELLSYGDRHYSNLGYSMLGIALERVAREDYSSYVVNKICKPLKMWDSGMGTESNDRVNIATGYYFDDSLKIFLKTPVFHANSALYAGGMYSTAADLARFISFQFDTTASSEKLLSADNRRMMHSFRIGWKPIYPFVLHEGAMLGQRCQVIFHPELQVGWVILTNTTDFEFSKINEYISKLVVPFYTPKSLDDLSGFVGTYRLQGGYASLRIYLKDGNLYSTYLQEELPNRPLTQSGKNRFQGARRGSYSIGYEFIAVNETQIWALNLGQLMWVKE